MLEIPIQRLPSTILIDRSQVVPWLVFLVSPVEEPIVPVRLPLVINVVPVACSPPQRSGGNGTKRSISARGTVPSSYLGCDRLRYDTKDVTRRFATTSALAASSIPSLLLARGHQISSVPEVPLVVDSKVFASAAISKTSAAAALLKSIGAGPDVEKVSNTRKVRAGKGKLRNRRYRQRRGPLIVYSPDEDGKELVQAFRNIPGVETSSVFALNLLQLAPGGHLGRFIVWTSAAFAALDSIYGSTTVPSALKKDFLLPSNLIANADIGRLINSSEIQAVVRSAKGGALTKRSGVQKKNPLKNKQVLLRLNPYAKAFAAEALGQKKLDEGKPQRAAETFFKDLHQP